MLAASWNGHVVDLLHSLHISPLIPALLFDGEPSLSHNDSTSGTTQRSQRGLRIATGVKKHFKRAAVHPRLLKRNTFFGAWRQRPSQHVFWCIDHGPVQQLWSQAASQDETEKIRKVSKSIKQRPCTLTKSRTWFDSSVCINVYSTVYIHNIMQS